MLDKFIPPFILFLDEHFDLSQHRFWLAGDRELYPYSDSPYIYQENNTLIGRVKEFFLLPVLLHRADKIMLHGLFYPKIIILLFFMPWLLKKSYWIIWGGDLYAYQQKEKVLKRKVREALRHFIIQRIGHLVTYIEGDVDLARKWYGATGEYHECIAYPSNIYKEQAIIKKESNAINIQIGNSADPSNNHIEALEKLLPYKESNIFIYVPLSYSGNQHYIQDVIRQGEQWFGNKFKPITYFMPPDKYNEFLSKIDIAVFNHNRQQAMGNIITLLGLGKKVYLRSDITPWPMLTSKEIAIYDISALNISLIDDNIKEKNKYIIKSRFSKEELKYQLKELYGV